MKFDEVSYRKDLVSSNLPPVERDAINQLKAIFNSKSSIGICGIGSKEGAEEMDICAASMAPSSLAFGVILNGDAVDVENTDSADNGNIYGIAVTSGCGSDGYARRGFEQVFPCK